MRRCLDLARLGQGLVAPNPLVGSVVVFKDRIIGEGYHKAFGEAHAEVNAIQSVTQSECFAKSILYVNLEPCSHTGKTPPCADMIIKTGISTVVIGTPDPNPLVCGNGIMKLREHGIHVHVGLLGEECRALNRRFITFHSRQRPHIILKWAQTRDSFIDVIRQDPANEHPQWISNPISRMLVHKWRSEEQSILVGTQTALMDDPQLNVREWSGKSPLRMVIDRHLQLPEHLKLFYPTQPTMVFNEIKDDVIGNIRYIRLDFTKSILRDMLHFLYHEGIQSVLVEGGRKLLMSFIDENLWDEARVFIGPQRFEEGVEAPRINHVVPEKSFIRQDELLFYYNPQPN